MAKAITANLAGEQGYSRQQKTKGIFVSSTGSDFLGKAEMQKKDHSLGELSMTATEVGKWDWSLETLFGILAVFSTWETYPECFRVR